jgi:hypothetical protein
MEFLTLHQGELLKIIDDQDLNTPSEEFVGDVVMKWYTANTNVNHDALVAIFDRLKLQVMEETTQRFFRKKLSQRSCSVLICNMEAD